MKIPSAVLAIILLATPPSEAAENRYDVLGKMLAPFIGVLAKDTRSPNRAMTLVARLERLTDLPMELNGTRAEISLQFPDRLLVHGPILGEEVTVCRDRQKVWASPGEKAEALLDLAAPQKKKPSPADAAPLEPLQLPLPQKQLVFLPILFVVNDAGVENVDGEECRVLDLGLMPELQKSLKDTWTARVWVRANYKPARLVLMRPGWELAVKFDKVDFAPKLPDATWQPPAGGVLTLDAARFRQLIRSIIR